MKTLHVSASLVSWNDGGRTKLRRENRCRMCLMPRAKRGVRVLTRHHLVPKAWFNANGLDFELRDCDANIVPLCRSCHRAVELGVSRVVAPDDWVPTERYVRAAKDGLAARRMLRKVMTQQEIAFVIQVRGKDWLDDRYPPTILELLKEQQERAASRADIAVSNW